MNPTRSCTTRHGVAALAVGLAACGAGAVATSAPAARMTSQVPPNIVVITADDQSLHTFDRHAMRRTWSFVVKPGIRFDGSIASPPLCCPYRAGFLTGQYTHNNGVAANHPGYPDLVRKQSVLPAWLQRAGYRTGFVGKYLNGTDDVVGADAAPGWNYWYSILGNPRYWGTKVSDQGSPKRLAESDYTTSKLNAKAVQFVRQSNGHRPFFLWMAAIAPHIHDNDIHGAFCDGRFPQPLPRDVDKVRHAPFHKRPSFNESDVSDKPPFIPQDPLSAHGKRNVKRRYRCALGALRELDRGVGDIVKALDRSGELDNTEIVYTSDNGFFFGEHRLQSGKADAYEEALRVPLAVRTPSATVAGGTGARVSEPVAQIDLAPTFLDQAGGEPCAHGYCRTMDGRSLTGLLQGSQTGWPPSRGLLAEAGGYIQDKAGPNCGFGAIRTPGYVYSIDSDRDGEGPCTTYRELYDLDADPFELQNQVDSPSYQAKLTALSQRLQSLQRCRGIAGRDPDPGPNHDYCE